MLLVMRFTSVFLQIRVADAGSFGTEKEHYSLRKIKARSHKTELIWLYFDTYTAKSVRITNRRLENGQQALVA